MSSLNNPFLTNGYVSDEYFCERKKETEEFLMEMSQGKNISVLSHRGMGKTTFVEHCLMQLPKVDDYYIFRIDIGSTRSLREFVYLLGKNILNTLRPYGRKATQLFSDTLLSIRYEFKFDTSLVASWSIELGDIKSPKTTLKEIFSYLSIADKPCIVVIDEYQLVTSYPGNNIKTFIGNRMRSCSNARFVLGGSRRHQANEYNPELFPSFYTDFSIVRLKPLKKHIYFSYAAKHFADAGKRLMYEVIDSLYLRFDGITYYMQKVLSVLFDQTPEGGSCSADMIDTAINTILNSYALIYTDYIFQFPEKQKEVLIAFCKKGKEPSPNSIEFIMSYGIPTSSTVHTALSGLLEKGAITKWNNKYYVASDRFFSLWVKQNF